MMASFATYQLLLSILIGLAALTAEQLLKRWRLPLRLIWAAALCASLAFPLIMSMTAAPQAPADLSAFATLPTDALSSGPMSREDASPGPSSGGKETAPGLGAGTAGVARSIARPHVSVATVVHALWIVSCGATWLFFALSMARLLSVARACPSAIVLGSRVRLTDSLGPAVLGAWRPIILWPRWLQTAPPRMQRTAMTHELEHLRARDPLLLAAAMLLVSLAPWNPLLWWQLRRLRFAVEADCDRRVVGIGAGSGSAAIDYAEVLLRIGRHRATAGAGLAMPMSAPTCLEGRIRLLLQPPDRRSRWRTAAAVPVILMLLIGAAWVRAPSLAVTELRKLPPEDTSPAAGWAVAAVRAQFPELLQRPFRGTAVAAVVFDRGGHLQLAAQHRFAPGTPPSDFDMTLENARLGIDSTGDVLNRGSEAGGSYRSATIGPWLPSPNRGRLFIVYEVLKWTPDPTRRGVRVLAALKAYEPALFSEPAATRAQPRPTTLVAVFMNNDGSVNRVQKQIIPAFQPVTMDWPPLFAAMGLRTPELGRTGFLLAAQGIFTEYAWPRRPDDPPDVTQLDPAWRGTGQEVPTHQDNEDDAALVQRYFPDIAQRGYAAVTERVDGARALESPWILFGRDGRVWGTGRWHNESKQWGFNRAMVAAIEAHFPGSRVESDFGSSPWRVRGVPINAIWITPDSPIQSKSQAHWSQQKSVLVSGAFFMRKLDPKSRPLPGMPPLPDWVQISVASAMDFDSSTEVGFPKIPFMAVTATPAGREAVSLSVRFNVCGLKARSGPDCWKSAAVHARYDVPVDLPLGNDPVAQATYERIVVRVQRLRA